MRPSATCDAEHVQEARKRRVAVLPPALLLLLRQYLYFSTSKALVKQVNCAPLAPPKRASARRTRPQGALLSIRQHTSAYVSIRQHTSAYVKHARRTRPQGALLHIRQHTSAYVKHTSAYVKHTSSIRAARVRKELCSTLSVTIGTFVPVKLVN